MGSIISKSWARGFQWMYNISQLTWIKAIVKQMQNLPISRHRCLLYMMNTHKRKRKEHCSTVSIFQKGIKEIRIRSQYLSIHSLCAFLSRTCPQFTVASSLHWRMPVWLQHFALIVSLSLHSTDAVYSVFFFRQCHKRNLESRVIDNYSGTFVYSGTFALSNQTVGFIRGTV